MPDDNQQPEPSLPFDTVYLSWEYPEYTTFERGWRWYLLAIIVAILFITYGFFTQNYFFILIILMSIGIFVIANRRQPEPMAFGITDKGLIIKDRLLPYSDIRNFWIIYQPPVVKTLFIEPRSTFQPRIHINLMDQNPVEVRELLLQYLQEDLDKEEEPQSETLGRLLKF